MKVTGGADGHPPNRRHHGSGEDGTATVRIAQFAFDGALASRRRALLTAFVDQQGQATVTELVDAFGFPRVPVYHATEAQTGRVRASRKATAGSSLAGNQNAGRALVDSGQTRLRSILSMPIEILACKRQSTIGGLSDPTCPIWPLPLCAESPPPLVFSIPDTVPRRRHRHHDGGVETPAFRPGRKRRFTSPESRMPCGSAVAEFGLNTVRRCGARVDHEAATARDRSPRTGDRGP